ncbi:hypothetical protein ATJ97_1117 [Georgenia soli]|uniref:Uncharacterized protein n=1 Tax=Georgenia soli TaxID=638953 RepID=A0A2A9EK46_9MICO|nr:hypothetical protein [Georgenia soli]PFG38632.1 hypothetical protein ATJ97_1117 [Georgenia soli]
MSQLAIETTALRRTYRGSAACLLVRTDVVTLAGALVLRRRDAVRRP